MNKLLLFLGFLLPLNVNAAKLNFHYYERIFVARGFYQGCFAYVMEDQGDMLWLDLRCWTEEGNKKVDAIVKKVYVEKL